MILTGRLLIHESDAIRTYVDLVLSGRVIARSMVVKGCAVVGMAVLRSRSVSRHVPETKYIFLPAFFLPCRSCLLFFVFVEKGIFWPPVCFFFLLFLSVMFFRFFFVERWYLFDDVVILFILDPLIFV